MKKELLEQLPELIKDVKLFKLLLTPLELYTLKTLLSEMHPLNIRSIYSTTINLLFRFKFTHPKLKSIPEKYERKINDLINEGYGYGVIGKQNIENDIVSFGLSIEGKSETETTKLQYELLKKYDIKVPSYDKFLKIFERFESIGIIYKRDKEGKVILYALNPKFYQAIKDKSKEIEQL